jgi:porin
VGELGFFAGEVGTEEYYKVALGGWYLRQNIEYYTGGELAEGATVPPQFEHPVPGTNGVYLLAETAIGANLGLFLKAGWADPLYNRYSVFYSAGLNYSGLIPGRADDVLGVGAVQTRQGSNFLDENIDETTGESAYFSAETTFEITYSARVLDWLSVQPDIQYVQQPNMDINIKDAMLFGIRLQAVY